MYHKLAFDIRQRWISQRLSRHQLSVSFQLIHINHWINCLNYMPILGPMSTNKLASIINNKNKNNFYECVDYRHNTVVFKFKIQQFAKHWKRTVSFMKILCKLDQSISIHHNAFF